MIKITEITAADW